MEMSAPSYLDRRQKPAEAAAANRTLPSTLKLSNDRATAASGRVPAAALVEKRRCISRPSEEVVRFCEPLCTSSAQRPMRKFALS